MARSSRLSRVAIPTWQIRHLVSQSRPTSAFTSLYEARATSSFSVSRHTSIALPLLIYVSGTLAARTSNTVRWSPRGRHVVLATIGSSSKSELEFWDLDFNADDTGRREGPSKEEWGSGIQHLGTADHFGVTDVEWDPSGRYLATSASAWRHTVSIIRRDQILTADCKWYRSSRTATLSGTSGARSSRSTFSTASSSSSGARARAHFLEKSSSDRYDVTSRSSVASSTRRMQRRRATSARSSLRFANASSTNGTPGASASRPNLRRTAYFVARSLTLRRTSRVKRRRRLSSGSMRWSSRPRR